MVGSSSHWAGTEGEAGWVLVTKEEGNQAARNYCWEAAGGKSKPPAHKTSLKKCKHNDKITEDFERGDVSLTPPAWDPSETALCDGTCHRPMKPMKPVQHEEDEIRMAPAATDLRGRVNGLLALGSTDLASDPLLQPWTLSSLI